MPKENFIELFLSVLGVVAAESLFYWILYCFDLGEHPLLTYGLTTVIFDAIQRLAHSVSRFFMPL